MLQFLLTICDEKYHSRIEYIYNRFHDDMMRFAVSKFRTMDSHNPVLDAEDAVQRAYLRITKYIHNFQCTITNSDVMYFRLFCMKL